MNQINTPMENQFNREFIYGLITRKYSHHTESSTILESRG